MPQLSSLPNEHWDVIVVGTGMGGATAGHALAKAGHRVLFVEKGEATYDSVDAVRGGYAESHGGGSSAAEAARRSAFRRAGRATGPLIDATHVREASFIPFVGSGTGGSSALYGMALERFQPADFEPGLHHPDASESSLPRAWPIAHAEFAPYYTKAERLYRVMPSIGYAEGRLPPLSAGAEELTQFAAKRGLQPYRLPLACEQHERCAGCQGYLCSRDCKNDSVRICLVPALAQHGATLVPDCEVVRLQADARRVTGVVCSQAGRERVLSAARVLIAGGAIDSPALLLASRSTLWPEGLGNRSDQVGRNLMRHCIDLYGVFLRARPEAGTNTKEFALNDFYAKDGEKFGSLQSFGFLPPANVVSDDMHQDIRRAAGPVAASLFAFASPLVRSAIGALVARATLLAATMEDLPYADNRVSLRRAADGRIEKLIRYRLYPHEARRIDRFRATIGKALEPYRFVRLKQAENNQRLAHVCGTCRFGDDPATSVLDRNNKVHGLENLYVVDASFFPSSGGTNPALTIAANALRVADAIGGKPS